MVLDTRLHHAPNLALVGDLSAKQEHANIHLKTWLNEAARDRSM